MRGDRDRATGFVSSFSKRRRRRRLDLQWLVVAVAAERRRKGRTWGSAF
jgi:hypothetical protein